MAQERTEIGGRSEVKGSPVRTWWYFPHPLARRPPVLTMMLGEAGRDQPGRPDMAVGWEMGVRRV